MKKIVVVATVAALAAGALMAPAEAGKKKKSRVMEGTYDNPAVGIPGVVGTSSAGGAVEFGTLPTEKTISIEVADAGGGAPFITLSQDSDPSNSTGWEIFATACGATAEPLPITGGLPVRVSVYTTPGPDQPTCVGPATSGTIIATFK